MSEEIYQGHYTVLKQETVQGVLDNPRLSEVSQPVFLDLTFGGGGHSLELLRKAENSLLVGFDQDLDAIQNAQKLILANQLQDRLSLIHTNFEQFNGHLGNWMVARGQAADEKIQGALLDLGVSTHHFAQAERGFSFRKDSPLDMRMDQSSSNQTAADILNGYDQDQLMTIIKEYGEDPFAYNIVKNILEFRATQPIQTTTELENIVFHSYPAKMRHGRTHPATRTFQALRIEVNRELEVVKNVIPELLSRLDKGARLAIISFHSLEDRIVKHMFRDIAKARPEEFKVITKRPLVPSEAELKENSKSRSAKLRIIQKL